MNINITNENKKKKKEKFSLVCSLPHTHSQTDINNIAKHNNNIIYKDRYNHSAFSKLLLTSKRERERERE